MRTRKPQRRVIYVGCEGQSEAGYLAFIQDFALQLHPPVQLAIEDLSPKAGDPLKRVQRFIQKIEKRRRTRGAPELRFLFLDEDQLMLDSERAIQTKTLATKHKIDLVWQSPCFEALLLRHFPKCQDNRPPDTKSSLEALARVWPDYKKGLPRVVLAKKLNWEAVQRAASVEPALDRFLRSIGFKL